MNGHAHIIYELEKPVCTSENGSIKALKYLAAIQAGLIRVTRADSGYSNFITKNPLHEHWRTEVWTDEKYKLDYLAEFIELRALNTTEKQSGLGRNCTLTALYLISCVIGRIKPSESIEASNGSNGITQCLNTL